MASVPKDFQSLPEGAQVLDLLSKPRPVPAASPLGPHWTLLVQLKKLRSAGTVAADAAAAESWYGWLEAKLLAAAALSVQVEAQVMLAGTLQQPQEPFFLPAGWSCKSGGGRWMSGDHLLVSQAGPGL